MVRDALARTPLLKFESTRYSIGTTDLKERKRNSLQQARTLLPPRRLLHSTVEGTQL